MHPAETAEATTNQDKVQIYPLKMTITAISILLSCMPVDFATDNYYGSQSVKVAAADSVCAEGYNLMLGYNRIARANYKHANYQRALRFALKVQAEGKLYWDTEALKALLWKNTGRLVKADSAYRAIIYSGIPHKDILYEAHLNYAELLRLNMDYRGRERHLKGALSYSEGWQQRKVYRVLARHYFNVLQDFGAAKDMIDKHGEPQTPEGRAGYALLLAQYNEARQSYKEAMKYYRQASRLASEAGFVSFQYQAADGYMRSSILGEEPVEIPWVILVASMLFAYFLYSVKGFKISNYLYG